MISDLSYEYEKRDNKKLKEYTEEKKAYFFSINTNSSILIVDRRIFLKEMSK
jgi:hypothetical protein